MEPWQENPFAPPSADLDATPGLGPEPDLRPVPFEDLASEPRFWPRVWEMFRLLFTHPYELTERVPNTGGTGAPVRFALLLSCPLMALYLVIGLVVGGVMGLVLGSAAQGEAPPGWLITLIGPFYALMLVLAVVLAVYLGGPILHACLWMWGGTREGRGLQQTLRVTGYYTGFHMLGTLVPLVNFAVALGGPVFLGMALARVHRTAPWRGIVAAYTPLLLCCCLYGSLFAVLLATGAMK